MERGAGSSSKISESVLLKFRLNDAYSPKVEEGEGKLVERHAGKTGVIVRVDEAVDGCVRTLDVMTANGKIHTRDRTKLYFSNLTR